MQAVEKRKQRPVLSNRNWKENEPAKNIVDVNRRNTIAEWPRNVTSVKGRVIENVNGKESGNVREIVLGRGNEKEIDRWNGTVIGGVPLGIDGRWTVRVAMDGCTILVTGIVDEAEAETGTAIATIEVDMIEARETTVIATEGIDAADPEGDGPRMTSLRAR